MFLFRLKHTIGLMLTRSARKRAEYLKKHKILAHVGNNCMVMFRKIPLYPQLISLGDNVWIASNVSFVTHDVIHKMLNNMNYECRFTEHIGCIDIKDNVFIGANTTILADVTIGANTIIGAGALVNKDIPGGGCYAGVPARYICSMDEYIAKKMKEDSCGIENGFSSEVIHKCWEKHRKNV